MPRIGVFICHCGGNISDVVDVQRVAAAAATLPGVAFSGTHPFMCSDPGQALIAEKIREHGLNRVIVAACSPSLHELTFRRTLQRAGLNSYLYEHCNVREHVSWVIEDPVRATEKAARLVRAAAARSLHLIPLAKRRIPIHPSALVIGGGISGLLAARDLARRGLDVTLVERSPFLGGRMAQLDRIYPSDAQARELLGPILREIAHHPKISVYTNTEIVGAEGFVGDFRIRVQMHPRGVTAPLADQAAVLASCPEHASSLFEYRLVQRPAIYGGYPGCYPELPAIDWTACTKCGRCLDAAGGKGIDLDATPRQAEVKAGVIILATGFDPYEPHRGEFGYQEGPGVITLPQLHRLLDPEGPARGQLRVNGRAAANVAFIHCVGSRQVPGVHAPGPDGQVNEYCSRYCCTAILNAATQIKERFPETSVFDFYEDIRTYGRGHEHYYERASEQGVLFFRYDPKRPPRVEPDPRGEGPLVVRSIDRLTMGHEVEAPADLVVLGCGMVPRNISQLVDFFRCAKGADRFLLEVHPKLRPVELAVFGVFVAGTAQGPMDITESSAAAKAAAAKAAALIVQGEIELDPFIAEVQAELCTGCQTCLYVCPYNALSRDAERRVATVNAALCTGCGTCVAACPSNAIEQYGFTHSQIDAEFHALLEPEPVCGTA